jgi:hypothetical protein
MIQYEIRILRSSGLPLTFLTGFVSDFAAIRQAQRLIDEGDEVEVWRELVCLYDSRRVEILLH